MNKLKKEIIELSKSLNIDLIGFCKIEYFKELENIFLIQDKLNFKTPFQVGKIDDKVFKDSIYKTAIVIGESYNKIDMELKPDEVYFSSCAWGSDYHIVIKEKLKFISDYLLDLGYKSLVNVDNNHLDERYLAYKAGLGFYGKNKLLINDKYGSYFFIGVILTDAVIDSDKSITKSCSECNRCIESCPSKSLDESVLNGNTCVSYLTQKKVLTEEEKKYINSCVYGCDICQSVCPHNNNLKKSNNFKSNGIELFSTEDFLKMSSDEYIKKYSNNSSFWRGKKIIDRNINIYLENKLK